MGREHLWFLSATSLNAEAQKKTWEDHGIFILFPGSLLSAAMPGISLRPYSVAVQSRTFWASEPDFLIWSDHFLPSSEEKQKHFLGSPVLTSSQDTQEHIGNALCPGLVQDWSLVFFVAGSGPHLQSPEDEEQVMAGSSRDLGIWGYVWEGDASPQQTTSHASCTRNPTCLSQKTLSTQGKMPQRRWDHD